VEDAHSVAVVGPKRGECRVGLKGQLVCLSLQFPTRAHWIRLWRMSPELVFYRAPGTNLAPWRPEFLMAKEDRFPKVLLSAHKCVRTVESVGAQDMSGRGVV